MSWLEPIYRITEKGGLIRVLIHTTYFIYIALFIGITFIDPKYIQLLHTIVNIYIGISLIYYFNPFYKAVEITSTLKRIIFISGLVLLTNVLGNEFVVVREKSLKTIEEKTGIHVEIPI